MALDDLEKQGGPILRRLRKDLQQVPVVVPVGQDPQAPEVLPGLVDVADPLADVLVVGLEMASSEKWIISVKPRTRS